jgi:hypothetical protein
MLAFHACCRRHLGSTSAARAGCVGGLRQPRDSPPCNQYLSAAVGIAKRARDFHRALHAASPVSNCTTSTTCSPGTILAKQPK